MAWQDILRNNSAALTQAGAGLLAGSTPQEQFALGTQGLVAGRQKMMQENKTRKLLEQAAPELVPWFDTGALKPEAVLNMAYEMRTKKAENPYMAVGGSLYNRETGEWVSPPSQDKGGKLGLNLVWGRDANGNTVAFQPSDTGGLVPATVPDGVQLSDPYYRAYEAASGSAQGKAQGEVVASAPGDISRAEETVKLVDQLITNPGLSSIVGPLDQYRPTWTLGGEGNDALSRLNQLQGGAFLQAFGMLKGGGAITEVEGIKAEQAIARMQRAQDEAAFKQSLKDFRDAVKAGADKLKARSGVSGPLSPAGRVPHTGNQQQAAPDPLGIR